MTLLNQADAIYLGGVAADKVYLGANLVWPPETLGVPDGVIASLASDWSGNPSSNVAVAWTAETLDTHGAHDLVTANSKIIIPAAFNGKYGVFHAQIGVTGTPSGAGVSVWITKGGSASWIGLGGQGKNVGNISTLGSTWCCSQPVLLATGEEYVAMLHSTDTALVVRSAISNFSLEIVG